jgi:hypothetical protein
MGRVFRRPLHRAWRTDHPASPNSWFSIVSHPPTSANHAPDWRAIEQDYGERVLSVNEICALHGIHLKQLYKHIADQGWSRRRKPSKVFTNRPLISTNDMPNRLLRALDLKMTELENRMTASTELPSAADCERNVRTLNTLVGLFEKLKKQAASDTATQTKAVTGQEGNQAAPRDADQLRRELAERLHQLGRARNVMAEGSDTSK